MRRLVLLRHGRTEWNDSGRAQGHADVPLDDVGLAQAKEVAPVLAALRPVAVWSSDLARAPGRPPPWPPSAGSSPVLDPRLREFDVGPNRQGLTAEQYAAAHPEEHAALLAGDLDAIPGRETRDDVLQRFLPALGDVRRLAGRGRDRRRSSPTEPPCASRSRPSSAGTATRARASGCWPTAAGWSSSTRRRPGPAGSSAGG